jgi:hypothetical protein
MVLWSLSLVHDSPSLTVRHGNRLGSHPGRFAIGCSWFRVAVTTPSQPAAPLVHLIHCPVNGFPRRLGVLNDEVTVRERPYRGVSLGTGGEPTAPGVEQVFQIGGRGGVGQSNLPRKSNPPPGLIAREAFLVQSGCHGAVTAWHLDGRKTHGW